MNSWERDITVDGSTTTQAAPLEMYKELCSNKGPTAKVAMTVGFAREFGAMKVSATVSLACDQNEKLLNRAGELAFMKAVELCEDGWRELEKRVSAAGAALSR